MASQVRLLIADDNAIVRDSLRQLFAAFPGIDVAGEAIDGPGVLERLGRLDRGAVDLLLLDLRMPGLGGEALIARIRERYADLPILVLSMQNEAQIVLRSLKAGANGYVAKGQDAEILIAAIREVAAGGSFIDPDLAAPLAIALAASATRYMPVPGLVQAA